MGSEKYTIGIDLGGTKIAGAILNPEGGLIHAREVPTNAELGPESVYRNLLANVRKLIAESGLSREEILGAGVGVPGVVSSSGTVKWAPALEWRDFPLAQKLQGDLTLPVYVENDVNLQALGEYHYGEEQGADPMVFLAVGTGLGSGIIINGRLLRGSHNAAGEVCNMVTDPAQLGKAFDGFGCLEGFASGTGIARLFAEAYEVKHGEQLEDSTGKKVFLLAREGDELARDVVRQFTRYLALAVVNISAVIDPEVIVLCGGVARNADLFLTDLYELCEPVLQAVPRLAVSRLDLAAGIKGAAAMARSRNSR